MRFAFAAAEAAAAGALLAGVAFPSRAAAEERPPIDSTTSPPAQVPDGYYRDDHGRLMQTEFDMNRRLWLGGGWAPSWVQGDDAHPGQAQIELGARIDAASDDGRWRGRFHLIEGQVDLGHKAMGRGTLFSYDESRRVDDPVIRITTFWPRPARHDLYLSLGFWAELLTLEAEERGTKFTRLRPAGAGMTWDLWHSRTLKNALRLRVGAALDDTLDASTSSWAATGIARLEFDALVDRAGFHRVTADAGADAPMTLHAPWPIRTRASAGLGYEVILIAINDQPITLRIAGRGEYRNDVPGAAAAFDGEGTTALRVNLWAPPPHREAREAPRRPGP